MAYNNQDPAGKVLSSIKKEYAVIGKRHVKTWHAWLIVGVFAGAVGATALVANRSGEVEGGKASGTAEIALPSNVELDLPDHIPEALHHPQRIFSGRKLLIKKATSFSAGSASLSGGGRVIPLNAQKAKRSDHALSVEIPADISSGVYKMSYTVDGVVKSFPLTINGLTPQEKQPARVLQRSINPETQLAQVGLKLGPAILYRTRICEWCYWEMSFAGDPTDPQKLVHNAGNTLMRSTTAGRSWTSELMNTVTTYPRPNIGYAGDPKIVTARNYEGFYLSALFSDFSVPTRQMYGGILYKGAYFGNLNASIFQDIPVNPPPRNTLFADYEKLAMDSQSSSLYIVAGHIWFEDIQSFGNGLYISQDAGRTFVRERLIGNLAIDSIALGELGPDRTLYVAGNQGYGKILRFRSVQPVIFDTYPLPSREMMWPPKVSTNSHRAWFGFTGPEIVADNSATSPHLGRLYVVWAEEEKDIADANFEYPYYGFNFDVFSSYSDNRGETWSSPVKVNDDVGTGDQFFPSARVDDSGRLHVAFVDHRMNQESAVFDVYYAYSSDGVRFSKNLRVTDMPTSNNPSGGRTIGDYLDMVAAYTDRVYVAYPCNQIGGMPSVDPTGACMVEIKP